MSKQQFVAVRERIICGEAAEFGATTPDDGDAEHAIAACDAHLATVIKRQFFGDTTVWQWAEAEEADSNPRPRQG